MLSEAIKTVKKGSQSDKPKVIILMGLPGSGKSFVSNYLYEKYGLTVLSGENITYSLFGSEKCSTEQYAQAYKVLRQIAKDLLEQDYSLVIDGTNLKYEFRQQIYQDVDSGAYLIYLVTDDETALKRTSQRGEDYSDESNIKSSVSLNTYNSFKSQLEPPQPGERSFELISDNNLLNQVDLVIKSF
jgi:predicted kinase